MQLSGMGAGFAINFLNDAILANDESKAEERPNPDGPWFTKRLHIEIDDCFYEHDLVNLKHMSKNVCCTMGIGYVGKTSYSHYFDFEFTNKHENIQGKKCCIREEIIAVVVDEARMKPAPIPVQWKKRFDSSQSIPRVATFDFTFPKDLTVVFESSISVPWDAVDINAHTNMKLYLIKTFDSIREAHTHGLIAFTTSSGFQQARIKGVHVNFHSETHLEDTVSFQLARPSLQLRNDTLYVTCMEGKRMCTQCVVQFHEHLIFKTKETITPLHEPAKL